MLERNLVHYDAGLRFGSLISNPHATLWVR